eukprot:11332132-Ditylum_brightwellii.AAC.1
MDDINIPPIEDCDGINKFVCKYIGKTDEQNYVIASADNKDWSHLTTRSTFLHNTKVSTSTFNKDKARKKECSNDHPQGGAVALAQMLHAMLKYPE